jgi:hypothetical protein
MAPELKTPLEPVVTTSSEPLALELPVNCTTAPDTAVPLVSVTRPFICPAAVPRNSLSLAAKAGPTSTLLLVEV